MNNLLIKKISKMKISNNINDAFLLKNKQKVEHKINKTTFLKSVSLFYPDFVTSQNLTTRPTKN